MTKLTEIQHKRASIDSMLNINRANLTIGVELEIPVRVGGERIVAAVPRITMSSDAAIPRAWAPAEVLERRAVVDRILVRTDRTDNAGNMVTIICTGIHNTSAENGLHGAVRITLSGRRRPGHHRRVPWRESFHSSVTSVSRWLARQVVHRLRLLSR